jgi:hypothetical protein
VNADKIVEYLTKHRKHLNIAQIANDADMPKRTLRAVANGERPHPAEYERRPSKVIIDISGGVYK